MEPLASGRNYWCCHVMLILLSLNYNHLQYDKQSSYQNPYKIRRQLYLCTYRHQSTQGVVRNDTNKSCTESICSLRIGNENLARLL